MKQITYIFNQNRVIVVKFKLVTIPIDYSEMLLTLS